MQALLQINTDERKLALFFAKLFLIWLSWKGIIFILGEQSVPLDERMFPAISASWEAWNFNLVRFIIEQSNNVLRFMGYESYTHNRMVWIVGANGIDVGNYCIGIQLMYYYIMLLLVTPMSMTKRLIGIPVGIAITFLLNIVRVSGLALVALYIPQYMFIAHDHVFNIIVFGTLIGFYYLLIKER
jgi:exosortase/archaeosortase family protein